MTAQPVESADPIRDHQGPWSETDYLALGDDDGQRIELLDGGLIATPHGDNQHQRLGARLWRELEAQLPDNVEAFHEANIRLTTGRILIPDLVVTRNPSDDLLNDAADAILVGEIESPSNKVNDRILKPVLYAQAGIPWYLRVERTPELALVLYREHQGEYHEHARGDSVEIPDLDVVLTTEALRRRR